MIPVITNNSLLILTEADCDNYIYFNRSVNKQVTKLAGNQRHLLIDVQSTMVTV
jgi:hypothetical protein